MSPRLLAALLLLLLPLASGATGAAPEDSADIPIPPGFVLQPLAETDGQIARPRDWFFASQGTPSGWMWTLSREDTSKGPYDVGMRIQMLLGYTESSGKPREAFVREFLAGKRAAAEVLRECGAPVDIGAFQRLCLEVIEEVALPAPAVSRRFRVLYSLMWGEELDVVVVTIFGAPPEEWETAGPIADAMAAFRLIGPKFGE